MPRFYYFVPGIMTPLENPRTWDYQAQLWVHDRGLGVGAGFNYSDGVIGANLALDDQAKVVGRDIYEAREAGMSPIVAAGHSNACRIYLRALTTYLLHVDELHLIAAPADCDCETNGLNGIARRKQAGRIVLYISKADDVLGGSQVVGYGELGKLGPTNVSPELSRILSYVYRTCRHVDWVGKDFEATMQLITAPQPSATPTSNDSSNQENA